MTCREAQNYYDDYLMHRLASPDKERFEEHLRECPQCRAELDNDRKLLNALKPEEVPDPGDKYWEDLQKNILAKTVERTPAIPDAAEHKNPVTNVVFNVILPLAASLLLLIASLSGTFSSNRLLLEAEKQKPFDSRATAKAAPSLCMTDRMKSKIIGSIMTSLPGSIGRHVIIMTEMNYPDQSQEKL